MKLRFLQSLIFLLVAFVAVSGQKQGNKVVLTGTVYDQVGNTCAHAKVIATNAEGKQFETTTKGNGSYEMSLPVNAFKPGGDFRKRISTYSVNVMLRGFHVTDIKGLKLVPIKTGKLWLDVVLQVGLLGDN